MADSVGEWSEPERVAEYLSREIPHRRVAEEMLLAALPDRVERFLDLGTGDGRLLAAVREHHPRATAIGIDASEPMLAGAARRFDGEPLVGLREHDLDAPIADFGPAEAVVSALAIHHLTDARKRALSRKSTPCWRRVGYSPTSISSTRRRRGCMSAFGVRSAAPKTTPATGSPTSRSSWVGCERSASARSIATSSGWSWPWWSP